MSTINFIIFAARNMTVMKSFTMKRVLATIFTVVLFLSCGTVKEPIDGIRTISAIQDSGNKYCIYDQKGKKVTCVNRNIGKLEGFGSDWFVVTNKNKIYLYDIQGHKYKSLSISSVGEVVSVGSDSFVTRKDGKLITHDKIGKKTNSRRAR